MKKQLSRFFSGTVRHRRFTPVTHTFCYPISWWCIDLDELHTVIDSWPWHGVARPAWFRLSRSDYLPSEPGSLASAVRRVTERKLGWAPSGRIEILTSLRSAGLSFNPVSFFLLYDETDHVSAILAEITNTPWNERCCYALKINEGRTYTFDKRFHISPFNDINQQYRWAIAISTRSISINMENYENSVCVFDATMRIQERRVQPATITRHCLLSWALPIRVLFNIYRQAAQLWWRGATFHPHPRQRSPRCDQQSFLLAE